MVKKYKEFKLGDIITTYHKGYWKLIEIQRRFYTKNENADYLKRINKKIGDEYSPIFVYEQVLTAAFETPNRKKPLRKECDAQWCRKLTTEVINEMIEDMNKKTSILRSLLEQV
jgi:hypothetical protein